MRAIRFLFAIVLIAFSGNATWTDPAQAESAGYKIYLPSVILPAWTFLPTMYSDFYSGIMPPKYATGTQSGPGGGTVTALAITSSGVIYAGSFGAGVFKSTDHATTWKFASQGLANGYIYSLAVDPTPDSTTLYAGTYQSGVYKSIDGGTTWNPTGPGLNPLAVVYALAINPLNPNIIFAGTRGDTPVATANCPGPDVTIEYWGGGIFRSIDGGAHWTNVDPNGLSCGYVYGLAIDSANPNLVYVATHGQGVLRSIDGGNSFQYQNSALGDKDTRSIVVDPKNHNQLFVATWHGAAVVRGTTNISYPLYNGADAITWNSANVGLGGAHVIKLVMDPSGGTAYCSRLFAVVWDGGTGLASSVDCGTTWSWVGSGDIALYSYDMVVDPAASANIYLGMGGLGVNKSTNRGAGWSYANQGLNNTSVNTLVTDPSAPATFYAGMSNGTGIFKSLDSGVTWSAIDSGLPITTHLYPSILKIAADPLIPGTLYAGTDGSGIYKSTDGGATWNAINGGLPAAPSITGLQGPGSLSLPHPLPYDAPFYEIPSEANPMAPVLTTLQSGSIPALVVHPQTIGTVYAGSWAGVLQSTDGGTSWLVIGLAGQPVYSLAIDPSTPSTLYAGTANGVYVTLDGGATWNASGLPGDLVYDLVVDSVPTPAAVYAGTSGAGIFKSFDGGLTWEANNQGLADLTVYSVAVDPVHHEFQYAGTASGLYRSTQGGALWEPVSVGLYNSYVDPVMVNPATPGIIYLGTNSGTVIVKFSDAP